MQESPRTQKNGEREREREKARESLRFVEEAPIKRHATNVTAPFLARVEGGTEGAWSVETMLGTQVEKRGEEGLRLAKNRGKRERGGQITKMGYIETWTKR